MPARTDLLTNLLKDVSRSFYLTLRALPTAVRQPIGLAYLLARASDTVADTEAVPVEFRLASLSALLECWLKGGSSPDLQRFLAGLPDGARGNPTTAEAILLRRLPEAAELLHASDPADRERIRRVLEVIVSGQCLDIERFAGAAKGTIICLPDDAALDDYTYRVAGCVGEFWTWICRAHLFPDVPLDEAALLEDAIRFGKGLQLVNILRDIPEDMRNGRCYLPLNRLRDLGVAPEELLDPTRARAIRPLHDSLLDRAQGHLSAGWRYTNTLPRSLIRVRLACSWPILIGLDTLERLRTCSALESKTRIKISRSDVRSILFRTMLGILIPPVWNGLDRWAAARGRTAV